MQRYVVSGFVVMEILDDKMRKKLCVFLVSALASISINGVIIIQVCGYSRNDFPPSPQFVFGAGTSAYQVEGAANEDGRTPSIMDTFAHSGITRGANGDVACDHYHKYKEDVQLMVDLGLEAYRFSISWSRLIPNGRGPVNPKGAKYYNNLINELLSHGIEPHVTLHHNNLPQALQDEYRGWLSRKMVRDFKAYADVCFKMFGDRVRHWTTFNEANLFVLTGYNYGTLPPQRCSSPFGFNCSEGDSTTEPYLAAHNIILAHAEVARMYKEKYQTKQKGYIGFNLLAQHFIPSSNKPEDIAAVQRANKFTHDWFADPLVYGDYPEIMKINVGSRLPSFTALESEQIKGSLDFLAINFYFFAQVKDSPQSLETDERDFAGDRAVEFALGANLTKFEYPIVPSGLYGVLKYFEQRYGNLPIYVHESGQRMQRNATFEDWSRVKCMHRYINAVLDSLRNGSNVKGYFVWSLLDVFELIDGYRSGFGLYYVDLDDPDLTRYPKLSARWYSEFLRGGEVDESGSDGLMELQMNVLYDQ